MKRLVLPVKTISALSANVLASIRPDTLTAVLVGALRGVATFPSKEILRVLPPVCCRFVFNACFPNIKSAVIGLCTSPTGMGILSAILPLTSIFCVAILMPIAPSMSALLTFVAHALLAYKHSISKLIMLIKREDRNFVFICLRFIRLI